jgi:hypothetical protein
MGIYADTHTLMKETGLTDVKIEHDTGIPKRWLNKFRNAEFNGGAVDRVDELKKYLTKEAAKQKRKANKESKNENNN